MLNFNSNSDINDYTINSEFNGSVVYDEYDDFFVHHESEGDIFDKGKELDHHLLFHFREHDFRSGEFVTIS